jgi:hypothetical protein
MHWKYGRQRDASSEEKLDLQKQCWPASPRTRRDVRVRGEAFAADEARHLARRDDPLEDAPEDMAFAEALVAGQQNQRQARSTCTSRQSARPERPANTSLRTRMRIRRTGSIDGLPMGQ